MLPVTLQDRIQFLLKTSDLKSSLITAREKLTMRYRANNGSGFASSSEALAYVAARLPATYAAMQAVLPQVPLQDISSILDLGAGPGTAALAAALQWPEAGKVHLIEGDGFMSEVSQKLLQDLPEMNAHALSFQCANLLTAPLDTRFDLILLSYVLNELSPNDQRDVLKKAWAAADKGLVIVVPGTPLAFKQLMDLRGLLIEEGAFIAAPCPHHEACPLKGGDWCHFSIRLSRPSFHREIKRVTLPYEDEKYSYLVALRNPLHRAQARIIRKPISRSGHVTLDLCTPGGLKRQTVSKKDKDLYKQATKVFWGEAW